MCAFFRAPIHDFVDLLIRQQFALTNNSMMTPLWMNPPVAPKLKGNLLRGIDNKIITCLGIQFVNTQFIKQQHKIKVIVLIKQLIYDFIIAQSFYKPLLCFWVGINKSCY